jgi:hypothetical protein
VYVSTVRRDWRELYREVVESQQGASGAHRHTRNCTLKRSAFASASRVQFAASYGLHLSTDVHTAALLHHVGEVGTIAILQAAYELGMPTSYHTTIGAAAAGSVSKIEWLYTEQQCPLQGSIDVYAACSGSTSMAEWLQAHDIVFKAHACAAAARCNHLPLLQLLQSWNCPMDAVPTAAAAAGHLEVLQWAVEQGVAMAADVASAAAANGYADVLHWALANGCPHKINEVRQAAAAGGILHLISAALPGSGGAPGGRALVAAASFGQLDECMWIVQQGCAVSTKACLAALKQGHVKVVLWFMQQGCGPEPDAVAHAAARSSCVAALTSSHQYWHEQLTQQQLTEVLNTAGVYSTVQSVQWLRQQGAEWPAVLGEQFGRIPWLEENLLFTREHGCTSPSIE